MSETMVDVNDVSIMFRLYRENVDNLKEFMIKMEPLSANWSVILELIPLVIRC